jgi:hypothetical protein
VGAARARREPPPRGGRVVYTQARPHWQACPCAAGAAISRRQSIRPGTDSATFRPIQSTTAPRARPGGHDEAARNARTNAPRRFRRCGRSLRAASCQRTTWHLVGPWRPHRQARNTEQSRYTQTCASLRHAPTATISRLKRDLPHIPACVSLASATHTSAMRRARGGANGVITGLAQSLRTNRDVRLILHSESDIAEVFRQIDDAACGFLGPFQAYRAKARR